MHWRVKGGIQKVLGHVPFGERLHYELQKRAGGLRAFDRELGAKIEDWRLMVGHLRSVGVPALGTRFLEMGTGWYPTFPFCLFLGGAKSVITVDLNRYLKPELMLRMVEALARFLPVIAGATGRTEDEIATAHRALEAAVRRGATLEEATGGVVAYHAPSDASATGLVAASLDAVFSNSVLEHVPGPVIERCFAEARRILRPGGVIFHSVNCGDHYAYADRKISQLNYLQFSDDEWQIWNNAFLYQNRLRAIDFVDMARAAGFSIEVDTSRPHPLRLQQLEDVKVHPQFARYSRDQLAITSIDFIGRNP
ncbi:MAG TPA: class I SAM-dependent methyltransferase [Kofleriaceae bacterium]|nr:class I SAM-dependent methyltransferase [Kofleriaceae bacterium]